MELVNGGDEHCGNNGEYKRKNLQVSKTSET